MPKLVKYALFAIGLALGLLLAAAGIVAATFNPNDYKPLIIKLVKEKKQRTLTIPGEIKLTFFPKIGADLGQISISEHNGSAEFASVKHAKVSLALIPLLAKQLVVDRIVIDGLNAHIVRNKDGAVNFDDLLSKEESGQQVKFAIDSVHVGDSTVWFDDRQQDRKLVVARLNIDTGEIADGVSSKFDIKADIRSTRPAIDIGVAAKSGFMLDIGQKHYVLNGLDADIKGALAGFSDTVVSIKGSVDLKPEAKRFALDGIALAFAGKRAGQAIDAKLDVPKLAATDKDVAGGKLVGAINLTEGARSINASFSAPAFEGSPQAFKIAALTLDAAIKDGQLDAKAKVAGALSGNIDKLLLTSPQLTVTLDGKKGGQALSGSASTPLTADLKAQSIDLPAIVATLSLPNPGGGLLKLKAGGRAGIDLGKEAVSALLKGSLDDSAFDARLGLNGFSPLVYTFDIGIDHVDADRYRAKPAATPAVAKTAAAPEQALDLSALKGWNANGSLRIDALKLDNIKVSNLRMAVHAGAGKVDVNPLSASLYGGAATGSVALTASSPPHFAVHQKLSGIAVGALLKDAIDKEPIEGRGNVQLDVTTQGATVGQLKKGLSGSARLELRDGAVRGVNLAQAMREAKAAIGTVRGDASAKAGTGSAGEKTDFSELSGSFRIAGGVAHNDDLALKSPLLRLGGAGDVNLGEDRLDYLAKVTVVSTLQGQGGPELQALKGVTVPVRLSGPFTAIGWKIDFAGLAGDLAKQKIEEKKEELKGKLQEQLKNSLKGLFGK